MAKRPRALHDPDIRLAKVEDDVRRLKIHQYGEGASEWPGFRACKVHFSVGDTGVGGRLKTITDAGATIDHSRVWPFDSVDYNTGGGLVANTAWVAPATGDPVGCRIEATEAGYYQAFFSTFFTWDPSGVTPWVQFDLVADMADILIFSALFPDNAINAEYVAIASQIVHMDPGEGWYIASPTSDIVDLYASADRAGAVPLNWSAQLGVVRLD